MRASQDKTCSGIVALPWQKCYVMSLRARLFPTQWFSYAHFISPSPPERRQNTVSCVCWFLSRTQESGGYSFSCKKVRRTHALLFFLYRVIPSILRIIFYSYFFCRPVMCVVRSYCDTYDISIIHTSNEFVNKKFTYLMLNCNIKWKSIISILKTIKIFFFFRIRIFSNIFQLSPPNFFQSKIMYSVLS